MEAPADHRQDRRFSRYPAAIGCTSMRTDGGPCRRLAVRGARVCYVHGGQLPVVREAALRSVEAARQRMLSLADPALDVVEKALSDPDVQVRLRAAREVLERVVPRQGSLSVTMATVPETPGKSASEIISERLDKLAATANSAHVVKYNAPGSSSPEIIEGEVLTEG